MRKGDVVFMEDGVGFVELVDVLGDDLTVVNAARVSMGKRKLTFDGKDENLIDFLANSEPQHSSPFRHGVFQFHIKAPEFVGRQWYKHAIGGDYAFKDTAWNEISGRYVQLTEFWYPEYFRLKAPTKKQGSVDEPHPRSEEFLDEYRQCVAACNALYTKMLDNGVAPEQARTVLPIDFYTEWYWTASLQAVLHFTRLRNHPEAQKEIKDYAIVLEDAARARFPVSWEYFKNRA